MDLLFLMVALGWLLVALISAFATLGLSPPATKIADGLIKGSCTIALVSIVLAVLFLLRPTLTAELSDTYAHAGHFRKN